MTGWINHDTLLRGALVLVAWAAAFVAHRRLNSAPKQATFVYCPTCRLEQCANGCFVEDADLVRYRCVRCGTETDWLFDAPVPLLIHVRRPAPLTT